jgi:pimeloyl-ACP methyl ester carboxylesterase
MRPGLLAGIMMLLPWIARAQALQMCDATENPPYVEFNGFYGLNLNFSGPCFASANGWAAQGEEFLTIELHGETEEWPTYGDPLFIPDPDSWQITISANPGGVIFQNSGAMIFNSAPPAGWVRQCEGVPGNLDVSCWYSTDQFIVVPIAALTKTQSVQLTLSLATQSNKLNGTNLWARLNGGGGGYFSVFPLVDPVPDLVNKAGDGLVSSYDALSGQGRPVTGVSADGVTRALLRVPTQVAGDPVRIQVYNDQGTLSSSAQFDGWLETVDGQNPGAQLTVNSVNTANGPMAFAVYVSPQDFSRGDSDDGAQYRQVSLFSTITEYGRPGAPTLYGDTNVWILRPPVLLIHGLWSDSSAWSNFDLLVNDPLQRFDVYLLDYGQPVAGQVISTTPNDYPGFVINNLKTSALGLAYNSALVDRQIRRAIETFKTYNSAAAVQADLVVHSMGGVVSRALKNLPNYKDARSFNSGTIHKLITIGTPHYGSPLATMLLSGNDCTRRALAAFRSVSLSSVTLAHDPIMSGTVNGGVLDLQGDGFGGGLSSALSAIDTASNGSTVPTAFISGTFGPNNTSSVPNPVQLLVWGTCQFDPLASFIVSNSWRTLFNQDSDGVVPYLSQVAMQSGSGKNVPGVVHSTALQWLGLYGPAELDPDASTGIPSYVVSLLNAQLSWQGSSSPFTNMQ